MWVCQKRENSYFGANVNYICLYTTISVSVWCQCKLLYWKTMAQKSMKGWMHSHQLSYNLKETASNNTATKYSVNLILALVQKRFTVLSFVVCVGFVLSTNNTQRRRWIFLFIYALPTTHRATDGYSCLCPLYELHKEQTINMAVCVRCTIHTKRKR